MSFCVELNTFVVPPDTFMVPFESRPSQSESTYRLPPVIFIDKSVTDLSVAAFIPSSAALIFIVPPLILTVSPSIPSPSTSIVIVPPFMVTVPALVVSSSSGFDLRPSLPLVTFIVPPFMIRLPSEAMLLFAADTL